MGSVVGQIVVVFDGLERRLLTVEAEVVDGNRDGKERGESGDHGKATAENGD